MLTLDLNARFQPMHRHELEDALEGILVKENLGTIGGGGGTLMAENGEIKSCDIEIDAEIENIEKIAEILNTVGIAKGSFLRGENKKIAVGTLEGLGIYLSVDLDEETYQNCDVNFVIEKTEECMHGIGAMYSYREVEAFTALYYYGTSFERMKDSIAAFLSDYPLCKDCKVIQIA